MHSSILTHPSIKNLVAITATVVTFTTLSACQPTQLDQANLADNPATAWSCQTNSSPFTYNTCRIDAQALQDSDYSLQLFWQQSDSSQPLLTFDKLLTTLPTSKDLAFAMNAGMYNESYAPIGYTVIEGREIRALNLKEGGGNFHLLPNGVVWWDKAGEVQVTESNALSTQLKDGQAQPWYASQSGPMLVIENEIHPQFNPDSTSAKFRNGIGVCSDGDDNIVQFVNSNEPVTFYQFASIFKDDLKCPNALFLDGGIASAFYAPSIDSHDKKEMGVMIGVVENQK